MFETAEFLLEMKKARKASKEDFILKQQSKGPGEGSGMALEVPDGPSGSSSSSSSEFFDDEMKDISSDDESTTEEEKVAEKQTGDVPAEVNVSKPQTKKTTPPLIILKDPVEIEIQSMVEVPVLQEKLVDQRPPLVDTNVKLMQENTTQPPESRRKTKVILKKSNQPDEKVDAETVLKWLKKLERKVKAISKIDHTTAINKSVQANLKKVLPTAAPGIDKLKPEKAAKQSMLKYSTKPFDDDSLKEYDLKHKLMSLMSKSKSFNTHLAHQELYDALMDSLLVDEDDMDNQFVDPPSLKKRRHDDQDPPIDADKDTKKRRKDSDASSSSKSKDKVASSKEGKAPSKSSKSDKIVDVEATVQDVAVDDEELAHDDVMDAEGVTHNDAVPKQDRSKWFKQVVVERPKTPDPKWHKEPTADDAPEHNWFNEMVNVENDPDTFDDLMGSTVDFTKNYIELEYNMKQCYLAFTDQIDWVNPEGDRCPYDLSKPLPLQVPPGRTTIPVDFFFNKYLEFSASCDKQFGYGYLKEIVVRRADQKEYVFKEADFPKLYLNDTEDMYL
ncbi:hypothetical protein Tco_1338930, partial [Tanacetum coccineum]